MSTPSQRRFSVRTPINGPTASRFRCLLTPTALPGADRALRMSLSASDSTVAGNAYTNEMSWLEKIAS